MPSSKGPPTPEWLSAEGLINLMGCLGCLGAVMLLGAGAALGSWLW